MILLLGRGLILLHVYYFIILLIKVKENLDQVNYYLSRI